jgi:hypothetical protein
MIGAEAFDGQSGARAQVASTDKPRRATNDKRRRPAPHEIALALFPRFHKAGE